MRAQNGGEFIPVQVAVEEEYRRFRRLDTKFALDRLFDFQAVATAVLCQFFHGFASFVAVRDDGRRNPCPGNHRAAKADARIHHDYSWCFMLPQPVNGKSRQRSPLTRAANQNTFRHR